MFWHVLNGTIHDVMSLIMLGKMPYRMSFEDLSECPHNVSRDFDLNELKFVHFSYTSVLLYYLEF